MRGIVSEAKNSEAFLEEKMSETSQHVGIKDSADVAIIGGGVNGCALAYYLAKKGVNVTVFEKDYLCSGATGRCGGGMRQQFDTEDNIRLAMESVKIFESMEKELGYDIEYHQGGYLVLAHSDKEGEQFKKNVELQRSMGLDVKFLEKDEINDVCPILDVDGAKAVGATFCQTDGHANPFKVTEAYAKNAERLGAKIKTFTEVKGIKKEKAFKIITEKEKMSADIVVDAAGCYSKNIAEMAGVKLPNAPYRHEILATEALKPVLKPMIISFRDGIYFSQQSTGQIVGGIPNPKEPPGINTSSSFWFLEKMAETITRYVPSFKNLNVMRQWAGMYDVTPDARPIIGKTKIENFFVACGFSGHGFMVAPITAKLMSELIIDGKSSIPIDNLSIDRFEKGVIRKEGAVVG